MFVRNLCAIVCTSSALLKANKRLLRGAGEGSAIDYLKACFCATWDCSLSRLAGAVGSQQDPIPTNRNNIHLHCRGLTHKLGMEIYIAALWYCIAFWVIYKCLWKENFHKNYASDDILELEVPQLSHYIQKDCCALVCVGHKTPHKDIVFFYW